MNGLNHVCYARCVYLSEGTESREVGIWPPLFLPDMPTGDDVRSLVLSPFLSSLPKVGKFYSFYLDSDHQVMAYDEFP